MIIGGCPYCDATTTTPCAENTPAFSEETCEACDKTYWLRHSRIDPESYTQEQFAERYTVDRDTMTIIDKNPPKPLMPEEKAFAEIISDAVFQHIVTGVESKTPLGLLSALRPERK